MIITMQVVAITQIIINHKVETAQNITVKYKMEICVDVILFVRVDNGQRSGSVLFRYCVM